MRCRGPCSERGTYSEDKVRAALGAVLGNPSEIFHYLGNSIVVTADNEEEETAEVGIGLDAAGSFSERRGGFRAQRAVVGQKIHVGMS